MMSPVPQERASEWESLSPDDEIAGLDYVDADERAALRAHARLAAEARLRRGRESALEVRRCCDLVRIERILFD